MTKDRTPQNGDEVPAWLTEELPQDLPDDLPFCPEETLSIPDEYPLAGDEMVPRWDEEAQAFGEPKRDASFSVSDSVPESGEACESEEESVEGQEEGAFKLLDDPLSGRTLIEASAGTGKTYSLEHIVLRLVVERGISIGHMLVVTFTKAATAELKSRIRAKLLAVRKLVTDGKEPDDANLLEQFERWRDIPQDTIFERLDRAVREFDDAVILTIHSFCQKTLSDFVFTSGGTYGLEVADDTPYLERTVEEFCRLEARKAEAEKTTEAFRVLLKVPLVSHLRALAREPEADRARARYATDLGYPADLDPTTCEALGGMLQRFLRWAPERYEALKREAGVQTFDDMLVRTEERLREDATFAAVVRNHYDVVLIDEFQDTDPLQYGVFRTLFGRKEFGKTVFFVGDPKQAIYSFRGADFETYRQAAREIPRHRMLGKNFRTTPVLMAFFNRFFERRGVFIDRDISYREVDWNDERPPLVTVDEKGFFRPEPAVVVRAASPDDWENSKKEALVQAEADDIADEIATMLSHRDRHFVKNRPLRPSDIAILVRKRKEAEPLFEALRKRGVRVRFPSDVDIFTTQEAKELCTVLEAMAMPTERNLLEAARATRVVGDDLSTFTNEKARTEHLLVVRSRMEEAAEYARHAGLAAAFAFLFRVFEVERRLLPLEGGERTLANYRQLIERFYALQQTTNSLSGLVRTVEKTIMERDGATGQVPDDSKLRPDSNEDRVSIETIHSSKGLEYPIVYLPLCWWSEGINSHSISYVHERDASGARNLLFFVEDVKGEELPEKNAADWEEAVRLFYVALTRASARLTLYSIPKWTKKGAGGLHKSYGRSVFYRTLSLGDWDGFTATELEKCWEAFHLALYADREVFADVWGKTALRFAKAHPGLQPDPESLKPQTDRIGAYWSIAAWTPVERTPVLLTHDTQTEDWPQPVPGRFVRPTWVQTSYTALKKGLKAREQENETALLREDRVALSGEDEENDESEPGGANEGTMLRDGSPMARWRAGTALGVSIHRLFEVIDFEGFDLRRALANDEELADPGLTPAMRRNRLRQRNYLLSILNATPELVRQDAILAGDAPSEDRLSPENALRLEELRSLVDSALSVELLPSFTLKDLPRSRRFSEFEFLLHCNPKDSEESFAKKAEALGWKGLTIDSLRGYLTGSIDLLFEKDGRFWILDWKTDNLAANDALRASHPEETDWRAFYTPDVMAEHMVNAHYDLQYLCYLVAVKRFLKERLGRENVDDCVGGALYFFLRGAATNGFVTIPFENVADRVRLLESLLGD